MDTGNKKKIWILVKVLSLIGVLIANFNWTNPRWLGLVVDGGLAVLFLLGLARRHALSRKKDSK
jgi:hypothetical protein